MTTEAFTRRGMERKDLLDGLMKEVLQEEEERDDPTFLFKLERALSEYLQQRRRNSPRLERHEIADEISLFTVETLNAIWDFSRSQVENDALVAELLVKVVQSATSYFRSELQGQEFSNPELIFHASSPMTEVPIE